MNHYFIDFENVSNGGIFGAKYLNPDSVVHIFYSTNAKYLTMDNVAELTNGNSTIKYYKVETLGHNALDHELIQVMREIIIKEKKGNYFIISNDKGYKVASNRLLTENKGNHITISQANCIANTTGLRNVKISEHFSNVVKEQEFDAKLKNLLSITNIDKLLPIIKKAFFKTNDKQGLYLYLVDNLGEIDGISVYKNLKKNYYVLKEIL